MKNNARRNYIFYIIMLILFGAMMWWLIDLGSKYDIGVTHSNHEIIPVSSWDIFHNGLTENIHHPLSMLLLQIIAILICVRIFSFILKYLGQPGVIGEIVAGIVLGPSVLGHFFPEAFEFLFNSSSLVPLNIISQIGLVLFMFVIGMELDVRIIKQKASQTLVISHASIIVPFLMGTILAYFVYPEFQTPHTSFLSFALFIGIAISITAFPVLARIIQERNLGRSQMGMLSIASAANNDITAWCLLAMIIAITRAGNPASALYTILLSTLYIIFMFAVVRPFMKKIGNIYNSPEVMNKTIVAFMLLTLVVSSYISEILGIHALFGAFLAGVIMPPNISFRRVMTDKVEDIALVLFLPLFFVFTGLRTEIGLLNTPHLWWLCVIFIIVSIMGKMLGASLSARFVGESWKSSLSIGVLMNTRGLMELIVLNIGYEMGVIPSSLFVIFVIMALFTTFMATPSLILIEWLFRKKKKVARMKRLKNPRILISFGRPETGASLVNLTHTLFGSNIIPPIVTAIHYTIGTDTNPMYATSYSKDSFRPLHLTAKNLGMEIQTRYKVTDHYAKSLAELTRKEHFDLVLMGAGSTFIEDYTNPRNRNIFASTDLGRISSLILNQRMYFPGALAHDKSRGLFNTVESTLGVFVNRNNLSKITNVGIIMSDMKDKRILRTVDATSAHTIFDVLVPTTHIPNNLKRLLTDIRRIEDERFSFRDIGEVSFEDFISGKHLILISYNCWLDVTANKPQLIAKLPSFVVVKPYNKNK